MTSYILPITFCTTLPLHIFTLILPLFFWTQAIFFQQFFLFHLIFHINFLWKTFGSKHINLELFCSNLIIIWQLKRPFMFSFLSYALLIYYVACLNNTHRKSYKSSHNKLKKISPNKFRTKLFPYFFAHFTLILTIYI